MFEEGSGREAAGPAFAPVLAAVAELSDEDLLVAGRQCLAAKAVWDARLLAVAVETYRRAAGWLLPSASAVSPPVGQIEAAGQELALALDLTLDAGCNLVDLALTLTERLPAVAAALSAGQLDLPRARLIAEATRPLPQPAARAVADTAVGYAPGTPTASCGRSCAGWCCRRIRAVSRAGGGRRPPGAACGCCRPRTA